MIELLVAALATGFLGSLHCIGMCGGLVGAMTMTRDTAWWPGIISYQVGRITTYVTLGLIIGLIGSSFARASWISDAQAILGTVAGLLIIILALHLAGWLPDPFARLSKRISSATGLSNWIQKAATNDSTGPWYSVGLLNGLLPCGLVYAGLGLSLTSNSAWQGAATMFAFGLGTLPAMLTAPALLRRLSPALRGGVLKVGAIVLIAIGILTIARGTLLSQHNHNNLQAQQAARQFDISTLAKQAFCFIPGFGDHAEEDEKEVDQ